MEHRHLNVVEDPTLTQRRKRNTKSVNEYFPKQLKKPNSEYFPIQKARHAVSAILSLLHRGLSWHDICCEDVRKIALSIYHSDR